MKLSRVLDISCALPRFVLVSLLTIGLAACSTSPPSPTSSTSTTDPASASDIHFGHPNWSPLGDQIAVDCGPAGLLDLCLYEVETGRIVRVTATPDIGEAVPVFSPDGRKISFSQERGDAWYLAVLDLETREVTELLQLTTPYASSSSWVPGGEQIAFDMLNDEGDHDIYTVRLDDLEVRPLITGPGSQRFATFSPDDTKLAYTHIEDEQGDIMVARVDGSSPRAVISDPADEGVPKWAPNGKQLSYYSRRTGDFEVFLTDLRGTERRLTDNPAFDIFASFAPDGSALVFESTRDRNPDGFDQGVDIYRLDLQTLEIQRLTQPNDFPTAPID